MSDPILTTERVKLYDIYPKIISLLTQAGWKDVSSNVGKDGNVMYSKGESGDMDLFLGFSKDAGGTDTSPFGSSKTADGIYVKLIYNYTPGATGTGGTYDRRRNETWKKLIFPFSNRGIISLDDELYMHYHVNKNRIVCYFEPLEHYKIEPSKNDIPQSNYIIYPYFFTFGYQDDSLVKGTKSSCVIFADNNYSSGANSSPLALMCSYSSYVTSDAIQINIYSFNCIREGTLDGKAPMLPLYAYTTGEGIISKIDGIMTMQHTAPWKPYGQAPIESFIATGDIVANNNKKYKVLRRYSICNSADSGYSYFSHGILVSNSYGGYTTFFRRIE